MGSTEDLQNVSKPVCFLVDKYYSVSYLRVPLDKDSNPFFLNIDSSSKILKDVLSKI